MIFFDKKSNGKKEPSFCGKEITEVKNNVLKMAEFAENATSMAFKALFERDVEMAAKVIENDDIIDKMELDIEEQCLETIALYGPVAEELRAIGCGLRIIINLERIADHAVNIARSAQYLSIRPIVKPLIDIPKMAEIAHKMVKDSLYAYINNDVELALDVWHRDDAVDELNQKIFDDLMEFMENDPKTLNRSIHLINVAKSIERIADYATNFAEEVLYMVKGERIRLKL